MFRLPFGLGSRLSLNNIGIAAALSALVSSAAAETEANQKAFRNHGQGGRRTLYTYWGGARRITHSGRPHYNRARENARNLRNMQEAKFRQEFRAALGRYIVTKAAEPQECGTFEVAGPSGEVLASASLHHAA